MAVTPPEAPGAGATTIHRRRFFPLAGGLAALVSGCSTLEPAGLCLAPPGRGELCRGPSGGLQAGLLEDLARRTFRYFWETTNPVNGLAPDRYPTPSPCSIAAVGFALTSYAIGVGRGYVSRADARLRTLTTLRFLRDLPQGPQASGVAGHKGYYYHFIDMQTGLRANNCELSTVDTALMLCGALHVQQFFDLEDPEEVEIRRLVEILVDRVDWRWAQVRPPAFALGWTPEKGFLPLDWSGYSEAAVLYLLAMGARENAVAPAAWAVWTTNLRSSWTTFNGLLGLQFPSLFGHQYSAVWVDYRGINDHFMRSRGTDYFENSRRAAYAQRTYAILNPRRWLGYDADIWGLTACDGPADMMARYEGERRLFRTYAARGAGGPDAFDDGTIAPTAAASSIAFAPEIALPAIDAMVKRYGRHIYTDYGFLDAFNPSFRYDVKLHHGRVIPDFGWVAGDHLGIDQGPILAMISNYTDGAVWQAMQGCRHIRRGLEQAGFSGGWLDVA